MAVRPAPLDAKSPLEGDPPERRGDQAKLASYG